MQRSSAIGATLACPRIGRGTTLCDRRSAAACTTRSSRALANVRAVTNEANRELEAACVAVIRGQAPAKFLLDRALASIEHLSEVAQATTRRLDDLPNA